MHDAGEQDAEEHRLIDARRQPESEQEREPGDDGLRFRQAPQPGQRAQPHQVQHRGDDDGAEHRARKRREHEGDGQKAQDGQPGHRSAPARLGAGQAVEVAASKRPAHREAAGESRDEIRHALAHELTAGVPGLALLRREGAGDRRGLGEADQRDHDTGDDQQRQRRPGKREVDRRQPNRDVGELRTPIPRDQRIAETQQRRQ